MKTWLMRLLPLGAWLAVLSASVDSFASGGAPPAPGGLRAALAGLPALSTADGPAMAARYRETACVSLARPASATAPAQALGFVCRTRDPQFLEDMGITPLSALPASARPAQAPASGLLVLTAMAAHPLVRLEGVDAPVWAATVDCDLEAGAVYRATGSCHVGVLQGSDGTTIYGNLLVQAHAAPKAAAGLQPAEIRGLWQGLQRLQRP